MRRKAVTTPPKNYSVCVHSQCTKAEECLHRIAFEKFRATKKHMRLINPDFCTADDSCAYYHYGKPVRFARGFTNFQQRMYPKQYDKFKDALVMHFGRNQYFERRRGVMALPPEEQELILQTLKNVGVTEKMEFDHYEDAVYWNE